MIAALTWILFAQVLIEPPSNPNLGYSAMTCPPSALRFMEANIWVGISRSDPENKRFLQECLPCDVEGGCQDQSVSVTLDRINYSWTRYNAGCFATAGPKEVISLVRLPPRLKVAENGGGCSQ